MLILSPGRKGVNPTYCQMYTEIKYVKNVSCVGHLSSVNLVNNAPHAVIDPPVGARLHQCWEKWEPLGSSPKVVSTLREGYTLPFRFRPNKVTYCNKQLPQLSQAVLSCRGTVSADKQECSRTGRKSKLTGFLQPAIFGTQTQQPVETGPGPEHLEHLFKHRVVQNGDPRDNQNLPTGRGVGHIHRFQRRLLPYTNSQSVQEVHAFSSPGSVLPVQSPTLLSIHSSHGVHSGGQRGQTHGHSDGYKDPPVPRQLAGESLYPRHLSPAYTNLSDPELGWLVNKEKSELATKQVFNFVGYQFDLKEGKVRPTTERWQTLTDKIRSILSDLVCPVRQFMSLIGLLTATEKQVHLG